MARNTIVTVFKSISKQIEKFSLPWVTILARENKDPYLVLIASLLSVRTKDVATRKASERLFAYAGDIEAMLKLGYRKISQLIYPVGFYRRKAKNILEISKRLREKYDGKVPSQRESLMSLPGVGRKVANLVLGLSFGVPAICVDTHVHRISNRIGIINTTNVYSSEEALEKVLPQKFWIELNTLMVTFGQNICVPRRPYCSRCNLRTVCLKKGVQDFR